MIKFTTGIILALSASAVMAAQGGEGNNTGCNGVGNANSPCAGTTNNGGNGGAGGNASVTTTVNVAPVNKSESTAVSGAIAGSKSKSNASAVAPTTVAPTQTTTVKFDASRIPVAGASAPAVSNTASCRVGISGGVQTTIIGLSAGGSYQDAKCDKRALGLAKINAAQIAHSMGANPEYFAQLFEEGVTLLNASGDDEEKPAAKKLSGDPSGAISTNP